MNLRAALKIIVKGSLLEWTQTSLTSFNKTCIDSETYYLFLKYQSFDCHQLLIDIINGEEDKN